VPRNNAAASDIKKAKFGATPGANPANPRQAPLCNDRKPLRKDCPCGRLRVIAAQHRGLGGHVAASIGRYRDG
jgi:hypothetical protein